MASSGNFPLWSPLIKGAVNLSKGNTRFDGTTSSRGSMTSFAVPTGTKFYVECLVTHATAYNIVFGVANPEFNVGAYDETDATMNGILFRANTSSSWDTCSLTNGSRGSFGSNVGQTSARVLAMTVNRVDNEIKMYLDNSLKHTISISATEVYHIVCSFVGGSNSSIHMNINCGHDSTGAGDFSAGSATDENGFGDFQYSPPSGFLAPSSANLPISDDIDPAQTDDDIPIKQFNAVAYTGNSSSRTITTNMQPDLVWIKSRSNANVNELYDSTRGATKRLQSNATNAEDTRSSELTGFSSSGFTLGSSTFGGTNYNSYTYVGWSWRANGGVTSSNTDGDVTSTVQSNTKAGFSIVQYVGNRSGNGTSTVGHGLGGVPDMFITKPTSHSGRWYVWHKGMSGASYMLELNSDGAEQDKSVNGAMSLPTSSVFDITWTEGLGENGETHIGYFWRSIEGYSKFGKFVGSGSETNSPFINLGFRPRMVFCKNIGASEAWVVADTARSTFNPVDKILKWNNANTEASGATYAIDIVSTGFKIRTSWEGWNQNGKTIIYGAWGDVPAKYGNTF